MKTSPITFVNQLTDKQKLWIYQISPYEKGFFPTTFNATSRKTYVVNTKQPIFFLSPAVNGPDLGKIYWVKPGETIVVKANSTGLVQLTSEKDSLRSNELAFSNLLAVRYPEPQMPLRITDAGQFKQTATALNDWYTHAIELLTQLSKAKRVSAQFELAMGQYMHYKFLNDLFQKIVNSPNAAAMLKGSGFEKFPQCDACVTMPHYLFALNNHNHISSGYQTGDSDYDKEINSAKLNYTGTSRKYLLFSSIKLRENQKADTAQFAKYSRQFAALYPKDTMTAILNTALNNIQSSKLAKTVNEQLLMAADGKSVKWHQVLEANKNKVILIDFWARYCGPCIAEMPFSRKIEEKFKNVAFVYVSYDASKSSWQTGMDEIKLADRKNSYLLNDIDRKTITDFYHTQYIPKYVIYNKQGVLVNADAPRPSSGELEKILEKLDGAM